MELRALLKGMTKLQLGGVGLACVGALVLVVGLILLLATGDDSSVLIGGGIAAGVGIAVALGCGESELDRDVRLAEERYSRDVARHKAANPPFDASTWLRDFRACGSNETRRQAMRVKIYEGTSAAVAKGGFELPSRQFVQILSASGESTVHDDDCSRDDEDEDGGSGSGGGGGGGGGGSGVCACLFCGLLWFVCSFVCLFA